MSVCTIAWFWCRVSDIMRFFPPETKIQNQNYGIVFIEMDLLRKLKQSLFCTKHFNTNIYKRKYKTKIKQHFNSVQFFHLYDLRSYDSLYYLFVDHQNQFILHIYMYLYIYVLVSSFSEFLDLFSYIPIKLSCQYLV